MTQAPVGVFGGTFNPVHHGHLRSALEIRERLSLAELRLMPAALPPHREAPGCPAKIRAELVELAVADTPGLVVDRCELERDGPSYTVDSLRLMRRELGAAASLCLVMGADAVRGLVTWHRWRDLIELAHIVVIARPGWEPPRDGEVGEFIAAHRVDEAVALQQCPAGRVLLEHLTPLAISSTDIRERIAAGRSPQYLLPQVVWQAIQQQGLYGWPATEPETYAV